MNRKLLFLFMIFLVIMPFIQAKQGHMYLLAVKETEDSYTGSSADLYLEIQPGYGRVFLDTFPLTKLDTQMSTRFAKEIACNYLDINCDRYDFIYTIRADSVIIGGPSAGAAMATLTIAMLENLEIKNTTSITGTINSGGLIGNVGGLKEKIDAGGEIGLKKILIPKGSRFVEKGKSDWVMINTTAVNFTVTKEKAVENVSLDLVEYGRSKGIEIVEVSTLSDVVYEFSGKRIKEIKGDLTIDKDYTTTMMYLANTLCSRTKNFKNELSDFHFSDRDSEQFESALNLSLRGDSALSNKGYYSAASYCFGANVKFSYLDLVSQNLTAKQVKEKISLIERDIDNFNKELSKKEYKTITDLETYMIVKERLIEAEDYLNVSLENINESTLYSIAFAAERLNSAISWYVFFDNRGKKFELSPETMKESCIEKLSEAEERYQYVMLYFPNSLKETRTGIDRANEDLEKGDYELCLFKAAKAKAEADIVLGTIGIEIEEIKNLLDEKLKIVKDNIIREQEREVFPTIAYSYYEYAESLKNFDEYSALLFAEYALELSNLELYFKEEKRMLFPRLDKNIILGFIIGMVVGFLVSKIPEIKVKKPGKASKRGNFPRKKR